LLLTEHLPEAGCSIRTAQELLRHADVSTTMIYAHVLNKGGRVVTSGTLFSMRASLSLSSVSIRVSPVIVNAICGRTSQAAATINEPPE
jgi:hypothetical protein